MRRQVPLQQSKALLNSQGSVEHSSRQTTHPSTENKCHSRPEGLQQPGVRFPAWPLKGPQLREQHELAEELSQLAVSSNSVRIPAYMPTRACTASNHTSNRQTAAQRVEAYGALRLRQHPSASEQ
jgi:hypothetical protein